MQNREPVGSVTLGLSSRQTHARQHSQSNSINSIFPAYRVSRRKSTSSTTASNIAAVAAAVSEAPKTHAERGDLAHRRGASSNNIYSASVPRTGSFSSHYGSFPSQNTFIGAAGALAKDDSKYERPGLPSLQESGKITKSRTRRASEGSRASRGESKRVNTGDLKCEKCGKGYKHSSCLAKHLWEHTPEWAYTSKLLISKHQQVQLLEAASVLVTMNQPEEDAIRYPDGDNSSSPAASGSSDPNDDTFSSADTTPPPQVEPSTFNSPSGHQKRHSDGSSIFSQSYQSSSAGSGYAASAPYGYDAFSHHRHRSSDDRPSTSGTSYVGSFNDTEAQADLAAAVGLLNCSYGTPQTRATVLPPDVPPVPPLPARYRGHNRKRPSVSPIMGPFRNGPPAVGHDYIGDSRMGNMEIDQDDESMADDDDVARRPLARSRGDEEDDGVFGTMEA